MISSFSQLDSKKRHKVSVRRKLAIPLKSTPVRIDPFDLPTPNDAICASQPKKELDELRDFSPLMFARASARTIYSLIGR
jgi:hypothetical protein